MDLTTRFRAFKRAYHHYKELKENKDYLDWFYQERPRLFPFKNKHAGQDCFIIGNGPSLNQMDLSLLNDYHTFGMNKIFLIFKRVKLDLSYLVAVNPFVVEQSREVYKTLAATPIFLASRKGIPKIAQSNVHYLWTSGKMQHPEGLASTVWEGYTVTYVALQIAHYMGFKNIFLVGVDHNFAQEGKPNEVQRMEKDDSNHFDPEYFKGQQWQLADLEGSELGYAAARKMLTGKDRKIYDATVGGKLEIFEKVSFEQALRMAKKK